jgi:hypothetical protein
MTSGRALLYLVALLLGVAQAGAASLDADTCARLGTEHGQLEQAGIEQDMAKGPVWGKANMGPEKLAQVKRYIELEELLLFRCRGKLLVTLPPEPGPAATGDQTEKDAQDKDSVPAKAAKPAAALPKGAAGKTPAQQPAAKPAQPKKQDTKKAPATARQARDSGVPREPVTEIAKTPPKAKVDDAYKLPPLDPAINPFADQLKLRAKE